VPVISVQPEDMAIQNRLLKELYNSYSEQSTHRGFAFTYAIRTYGCQLNESDSEKIAGFMKSMSFEPALTDDPDIMFFNTCSIRENADDRLFGNLGLIKAAKRKNPSMIVAVCGCMMKQKEHLEKIKRSFPYVDLIFGPQDIHRIPELMHKLHFSKKKVYDVSETDFIADDLALPIERSRSFRALVPVMFGCNKFCSYCIVPYTRGRERSRPLEQIVEEISDLVKKGFKEVMLLGQTVSTYGADLGRKEGFSDLLREVSEIKGLYRLRFMSPYPTDITGEVLQVMKDHPNIERHLHLPVQSGSNRILKKMNRKYTKEQFMETVNTYRSFFPDGTISTDIIVGFPRETEEDFSDTISLVKEAAFDAAFTFQFSARNGTPAAKMEDKISPEVMTERFGRLLLLQNQNCYESNASVVGSVQEVLVEGRSETAPYIFTGRTSENRLVNFSIPKDTLLPWGDRTKEENEVIDGNRLEGSVATVLLKNARPFSLEGRLEKFL